MIKSPYTGRIVTPKVKLPESNLFDVTALLNKMAEMDQKMASVDILKAELKQEHQDNQEQFKLEHQAKLEELDEKITETLASIPVPEDGVSPEPVDEEAIVAKVLSKVVIPDPIPGKPGDDAVVNEKKIAKMAADLIKVPGPKVAEIDHATVADKVLEMIKTGKKKLSLSHIGDFNEGLEQTIRPIRSLMAGFRGGGDVVTAGSNVTITTDANGKKVINSSGSGGSGYQAATGTIDGSNKVFVFATAPSAVVVDGASLRKTASDGTVNWTGTTTITLSVAPNFDIYAVA